MTDRAETVARAQQVAEDVLFPGALETDASPSVPIGRLDALASAGLYGLFGPSEAGGLAADPVTGAEVTEILAGACLTTSFVWTQHHSAVLAVANAGSEALRNEWLARLCRGDRRAGVAFAGLRRPGLPILIARRSRDGWVLHGSAPWVTGWGRIDVVHTAARDLAGNVVWLLVDASSSVTLGVEPLELAAVNASATVRLRFWGHEVPADRLTLVEPLEAWIERDTAGLARNGSFPLGIARRCSTLLGPELFDEEIAACRRLLHESTPETVVEARCRAAELAVRAASALMASGGGRSVLMSEQAQRLAREAMFLLVFGQTPSIRAAQLQRYRDGSERAAQELRADRP
ncbi:MAG: acyl-CoA dehydrogenase family protein [Acidimicrobiales bacterium]|jgi:alkylation response protein AidB-like acyl-CoA dehydrogenase